MSSRLIKDPQEFDPQIRRIIDAAEVEVEFKLATHPQKGELGFCHIFWEEQKNLLKEKYGIDWKTPVEMNPEVLFD